MKVLKSQLKRIIKEEVGKLQQEMQHGSSAHVTVENIGRDSVELRVSLSLTDGVADTSDLVPAVERAIELVLADQSAAEGDAHPTNDPFQGKM